MYAIYARQSVDKKDSISIETQIETCRTKIASSEEVEVFSDKGFSGKSTENRPEFQRMMSEVRKGNISKIVIYKLDRISRSLIDFLNMRQEFLKYNVELVSCAEDFDTSTASGKLMLNMLMMFAEMERETIQKRIKDNYYARGEKGLYLGGYAPFGYNKIETSVNGKKTYTFVEHAEENVILKQMYSDYADGKSLGEITRGLNNQGIPTRKGKNWSNTCTARILRNPVYVMANADVYNYLISKGATMNNPVEDYTGKNGCLVYGDATERTGSKFVDLTNDFASLGLHKGIIEPSLWLSVQYMFCQKSNHSNLGTGSLTWLQGLVKCSCGYTYYVKRCKTKVKEHRYLYCRGRRNDTCKYPKIMMPVEKAENIVEDELLLRLQSLKDIKSDKVISNTPEINSLKIQVASINGKIENLVNQIAEGSDVTVQYLNQTIEKLDSQKREMINEITKRELKVNKTNETNIDIDEIINDWTSYDLETKKKITKELIEKIVLEGEIVSIIFY